MGTEFREAVAADAGECARIVCEAFRGIAEQHRFPLDFPTLEAASRLTSTFIAHSAVYGVIAERDGRIVGSNFLDERNPIRGVGPISVDPNVQERGIGRALMEAVVERGRGAAGIRLLQDSFNTVSISLYASLGFEVKEPVLLMAGKPKGELPSGIEVRKLEAQDVAACSELCLKTHGFERTNELIDALKDFSPFVALRENRVTAYASAPTFWLVNHGVAETEKDMKSLILGGARLTTESWSFLVPTRQASFFRWCLGEGLRVVKPMTLMAMGEYLEPRGCYFPSVSY